MPLQLLAKLTVFPAYDAEANPIWLLVLGDQLADGLGSCRQKDPVIDGDFAKLLLGMQGESRSTERTSRQKVRVILGQVDAAGSRPGGAELFVRGAIQHNAKRTGRVILQHVDDRSGKGSFFQKFRSNEQFTL